MRLPERQQELLRCVCLKRYTVTFLHYMGSFRPSESVVVAGDGARWDFRPATAYALRDKGLVCHRATGHAESELRPTRAGLEAFRDLGLVRGAQRTTQEAKS